MEFICQKQSALASFYEENVEIYQIPFQGFLLIQKETQLEYVTPIYLELTWEKKEVSLLYQPLKYRLLVRLTDLSITNNLNILKLIFHLFSITEHAFILFLFMFHFIKYKLPNSSASINFISH